MAIRLLAPELLWRAGYCAVSRSIDLLVGTPAFERVALDGQMQPAAWFVVEDEPFESKIKTNQVQQECTRTSEQARPQSRASIDASPPRTSSRPQKKTQQDSERGPSESVPNHGVQVDQRNPLDARQCQSNNAGSRRLGHLAGLCNSDQVSPMGVVVVYVVCERG